MPVRRNYQIEIQKNGQPLKVRNAEKISEILKILNEEGYKVSQRTIESMLSGSPSKISREVKIIATPWSKKKKEPQSKRREEILKKTQKDPEPQKVPEPIYKPQEIPEMIYKSQKIPEQKHKQQHVPEIPKRTLTEIFEMEMRNKPMLERNEKIEERPNLRCSIRQVLKVQSNTIIRRKKQKKTQSVYHHERSYITDIRFYDPYDIRF